jgi:predicted Kef-type K+ transport protein
MITSFHTIQLDILWLVIAFVWGLIVSKVGLPPLVGYLVAGFVLNGFGIHGGAALESIADLGVILLLFTIGLKLKLKNLAAPEIWAGACFHALLTVVVFGALFYMMGLGGLAWFQGFDIKLALLIAFALSFSSTVFAVKVLEQKNEMEAFHGRLSIGILIMQDVIAVVFLTVSTGKIPSAWAILVIGALFVLRPVLCAIMNRCGHGELLMLFGIMVAYGGVTLFDLVGLKPDLGSLIFGLLLATSPKADELSKSLLSFKDLFLVGFFLNIGMAGLPTWSHIGLALFLVLLLPFKVALFFGLFTGFKHRARTSMLASFNLANYSEFGLIVAAYSVKSNYMPADWLIIIAIALSFTLILASPFNVAADQIYERFADRLKRYERGELVPEEKPATLDEKIKIAIFGMGPIGTSAYDRMRERYGDRLVGIDHNPEVVEHHRSEGRHVLIGSALDPEFWKKNVLPQGMDMEVVMLAMPDHTANLHVTQQLREKGFKGQILATALYEDEMKTLLQAGANAAYQLETEAGIGFADQAMEDLNPATESKNE